MSQLYSKQQIINELWTRCDLSFKFHAGQRVIDEAYKNVTGKLFVGNCSRRFGKTTWAVTKCLEVAISNPNTKSIIATAFQTDCENIIIPIIQDLLSDCPKSLYPTFNKTKKRYVFKNGSSISIVGLDKNPDALRGNKLNGVIVLDEAGFIDSLNYIYSSIIVPATMYTDSKVICISTPSSSPNHPFKTFCDKAMLENAYVKLTIYDNPLVTPEIIEQYRKECLTVTDFNREYLCKFEVDETLHIIPEFKDEHIVNDSQRDEYFKYYRKYICFDIGVVDPTSFIYAYFDYSKQKLIIECESQLQNNEVTTENINNNLELFQDYKAPFKTISDNNNLILIQDLNSKYQKVVNPVKKDSLHAMISELRWLFKSDKILISHECKNLINQLRNGIWNKHKTEFARQSGHHNDFIAAITYLVRSLNEYENPIPLTHNTTFNHYVPSQGQSESINQLMKLFN